jgi:6,7-dimethyl-8-ribityllumazine synthase
MKAKPTSVPTIVPGKKPMVLIVEARFYDDVADELLAGAKAVLDASGARADIVTVPGALEIPAAVSMAIRAAYEVEGATLYDGYVVLGCVIRGETGHYDIVAENSNRALMDIVVRDGVALGNGILTVETMDQALARAKASDLDKGGGAARACLSMIAWQRKLGLEPVPASPVDDLYDQMMLEDMLAPREEPPPRKGFSLPGLPTSDRKGKGRR